MKLLPTSILVASALIVLSAANTFAQAKKTSATPPPLKLRTRADKISYGIGLNIAQNLKQQGFDSVNVKAFIHAFEDIKKNQKTIISQEEANAAINNFFQEIQARKGKVKKEEGLKFLEENKKNPGVVVLPSGLQYLVLTEGTGDIPKATDKVKTNYEGRLINGEIFDSSIKRGEPATFPVNGVIQGWQEALQLMKVGSKWKLFVPSQLAYGERGAGQNIGPNETLIFDIELLSIEK